MNDYAAMLRREARYVEERDGGGFQWLDEAAATIELLRAELLSCQRAYVIAFNATYQGHNHWDLTRRHGAECPECQKATQQRDDAEEHYPYAKAKAALAAGGGDD